MKKNYLIPSMEIVEIQQKGNILIGSITDIEGNIDINYGGGGCVEPMAPELGDNFGFDDLGFDDIVVQ